MGLPARIGYQQLRTLKKLAKRARSLIELKDTNPLNFKRDLNKLEAKGLVVLGGDLIKISTKGKELIKKLESYDLDITLPKKWNGTWHVIAYDIPEHLKKERDYFRRKLNEKGFKPVQESLWVFPYDCREEIAIFTKTLNINNFVVYLNTNSLPNNSSFIKKFNLK